ncbi:MAG: DUF4956 domain-containing protein [Ruminococcaceae bacterium]|nr:DUF4956 domain-containing protein [Oscillospiraceae bacterium]
MTNFTDIFKSEFLSSTNLNSFSVLDTLLALALAFVLGLYIYLIYKKTYKGVMYSASFGVSLISMAMITTLVILAVTANIVLSLGMVGALSIVRFRTAIKEPMDIAFLFWAIAAGIVLGAGLIPLAVIGSVIIGIIILIFANIRTVGVVPYILVVSCSYKAECEVNSVIKHNCQKYLLKSKSVTGQGLELTYEVRLKDREGYAINKLMEINGVGNATLVSYNGEYMS